MRSHQEWKMRTAAIVFALSIFGLPVLAIEEPAPPQAAAAEKKPAEPSERLQETTHTLRLGNTALSYRALAGEMVIRDEKEKPTAKIFYVAYLKKEDGKDAAQSLTRRPVTFAFNGGPGSSAVWLHLGAFGPRRVVVDEMGRPAGPPYSLEDNPESLLDLTDLVFVDPVSTGFSRTVEGQKAEPFHEVHGDIESMAEFIRVFTTRHGRWASPIFLAGESYGTIRASGLADYLQRRYGLYPNGVVLLSQALNEATFMAQPGNDLAYMMTLPSFAATAWYHEKLASDLQGLGLEAVIEQASAFALGPYANALLRGASLPAAERAEIVGQLARFTGLPAAEIEKRDLRVDHMSFAGLLLEGDRLAVGLLDSRYTGFVNALPNETFAVQYLYPLFDPFHADVAGMFTATLHHYLKEELKFASEERYETLAMPVAAGWDYRRVTNRYLYAAGNLKTAMTLNPKLKVFVANGDYDLVTTHLSAEYVIDHLGLDARLQKNIKLVHYPAGHMMYMHAPSLEALKKDLAAFYRAAVPCDC